MLICFLFRFCFFNYFFDLFIIYFLLFNGVKLTIKHLNAVILWKIGAFFLL